MDNKANPASGRSDSGTAFRDVNPHCLESIVGLSEQQEVLAGEDIFDEHGVKLWAKGKPVSRKLQEKLLMRKLAQPLEATLTVEHGVGCEEVVAECRRLLDENEVLRQISGSAQAGALLATFRHLQLPGPAKLLLTSAREAGRTVYKHSLYTVAVAAGIAARLDASDHDAQTLLTAALLHDVGEMYVKPELITGERTLALAEWKFVATHPRVGQMFIEELTHLPAAVSQCVAQHHERLDGSGYPFQLARASVGRLGAWLAVADPVAAIIARGGDGLVSRIGLALKIVPEEFDRAAASAISEALKGLGKSDYPCGGDCSCLTRIATILERLDAANGVAGLLAAKSAVVRTRDVAAYAAALIETLKKTLRATGVSQIASLTELKEDPQLLAEVCLVAREVEWRLRNLGRNVFLRADTHGSHGPDGANDLALLVESLSGPDPAAPACGN